MMKIKQTKAFVFVPILRLTSNDLSITYLIIGVILGGTSICTFIILNITPKCLDVFKFGKVECRSMAVYGSPFNSDFIL